jgi:ATP-dependent DNA helicase PIF1
VVEFDNGQERTICADCCVEEYSDNEVYSLLSRTQVLLMAGYAMTIHKAQVENPYPLFSS